MQVHEFFSKYANTPILDRMIKIDFNGMNLTLSEIYEVVKSFEDRMRPMKLQQEELIKEAQKLWNRPHPDEVPLDL